MVVLPFFSPISFSALFRPKPFYPQKDMHFKKKSVKFNTSCVDTEVTRRIHVPWHANSVSFNTYFSYNFCINTTCVKFNTFFYSVDIITVNSFLNLIIHFKFNSLGRDNKEFTTGNTYILFKNRRYMESY